jgi:hypothetical protein
MSKLNQVLLGTALAVCAGLCGRAAHAQAALTTNMDQLNGLLDLMFVAQNSDLYETAYPFSATSQITGIGGRPAVAPQGNVTSYVNTIYGAQETFYVTSAASGSLDIEQLWGTTFSPTDLSQKTGAASAMAGSSLVGFIDSCASSDNVFYVGSNGHIELLTWTPAGGWLTEDLTATTNTAAAAGTTLIGHIKGTPPDQAQEVFYVETDDNVHELWRWSGCTGGPASDGWHNSDVSTANGDTGPAVAANSSVSGMFDPNSGTDAVFYVGTDSHLHELYFSTSGIWSNIDVTASTSGPALLASTPLVAHINSVAGSEEVFYFDPSSNVRESWAWSSSSTTWHSDAASLNSYAGGAPAAELGSPLITDVNTAALLDDVYYVGSNQNIYELTGGSWRSVDITTQAMAPSVRGEPPGGGSSGPQLINFDTDTLGNAIASGMAVDSTYANWGVTFSAQPCVTSVPSNQCEVPGTDAYAVAYPAAGTGIKQGSAPNAVSTLFYSAIMNAQAGVMRATFMVPQAAVTIDTYQICGATNGFGCMGTYPSTAAAYLDAYDVNGNLIMHTPAPTSGNNWLDSWWELRVCNTGGPTSTSTTCSTTPTIAYVQFSVGYNGSDSNSLAAYFDNLQFDTVPASF